MKLSSLSHNLTVASGKCQCLIASTQDPRAAACFCAERSTQSFARFRQMIIWQPEQYGKQDGVDLQTCLGCGRAVHPCLPSNDTNHSVSVASPLRALRRKTDA